MKKCTKCNLEKEEEMFRKGRNQCKECSKELRREYNKNNPEKIKRYTNKYNYNYRLKNLEKLSQANKEWRLKNREVLREKKRKYNLENRDYIRQKCKDYYTQNIKAEKERHSRYYNSNKEKLRCIRQEQYRLNKEYYKNNARRREIIKLNAIPSWSVDNELNDLVIKEVYVLAKLRSELTGIKHHVDHIVPLRSKLVCGLHIWNNLQVIPAVENLKKGNRVWPDMPQ